MRRRKSSPVSKPAIVGFGLAIASLAFAVLAALGPRLDLWDYDIAVQILSWAVYGGVLAAVVCLVGALRARRRSGQRGFLLSVLGLIVLMPALVLPAYWHYTEARLPPIQDITTDTEDPPQFWVAPISRIYGGPATAALQREAYPDIGPAILPVPAEQAVDHALELVREMGWELLVFERDEGRIEATATTLWLGFKDDVVVRVTPIDGGSRVDMRSASRFGSGGDGGVNANRIRTFLAALNSRVHKQAK